jgi:hypothetical protein
VDHPLIRAVENALEWDGASMMGRQFAYGSMDAPELCARLLTPVKMLDLIM